MLPIEAASRAELDAMRSIVDNCVSQGMTVREAQTQAVRTIMQRRKTKRLKVANVEKPTGPHLRPMKSPTLRPITAQEESQLVDHLMKLWFGKPRENKKRPRRP